MPRNIQHPCATYLVLHGVNSLQELTLLFVHKGLLSTKPSLLSAGVPYTPALFFPYSLRSFPEARLSETELPRITAVGNPGRANSVHDGLLKGWRPPRVYLFKVLPGVEQGWHYVFSAAPSSVHGYEFIGVWVSAEHPKGLCVRHWVLGVLHTPSGRVVPIHLESSFQD